MSGALVEISSKSVRQSSFRLSTKNAWAQYVRRRFNGQNLIKSVQAEWSLTEGKARGLVYAQATQATIDEVFDAEDRKRAFGAFRLGLTILEIRTQTELRAFIAYQAEEASLERHRWEQEERRLADLEARLARPRRLDRQAHLPPRTDRSTNAPLGAGSDAAGVEPRTFHPSDNPFRPPRSGQ